MHEYLQYFPEAHYKYLDKILEKTVHDDKLKEYQEQLIELCKIHKWSSQYFHRFFYRVIYHHPEYLKSLTDRAQLSKISSGLLAMVDRHPDTAQKKSYLADYYDLEFLRVGIGTMRGIDLNITNREFTEFCDSFMKKLFDICAREVETESKVEVPDTDTLAILAAGGHARGKAYDDDYDLIVVVDTDDHSVIEHATKIVSKMNREILKRGVLPHYRLGEILNGFVSPISKIEEYLHSEDEESFIDLSQLLGARIIIGSEVMKSTVYRKILDRFIFSDKSKYISRMIKEIRSRQQSVDQCDDDTCNIKETKGGLRDIEAIALMLKAFLGITDPIVKDFFKEIKIYLPDLSHEMEVLGQSIYYLRTFRDLYRITVAAEDALNPDYMIRLSTIFEQYYHSDWSKKDSIMNQIKKTLNDSTKACDKIIAYLSDHIS
jgi:glutamine synthetase adenylyltransferase